MQRLDGILCPITHYPQIGGIKSQVIVLFFINKGLLKIYIVIDL